MKISLNDTVEFIPKWNKNQEQPEEEQIVFTLKQPTFNTKGLLRDKKTDKEKDTINSVFMHFVTDIKNLELEDGTIIDKSNFRKLHTVPGAYGLMNELCFKIYKLMNGIKDEVDPLLDSSGLE